MKNKIYTTARLEDIMYDYQMKHEEMVSAYKRGFDKCPDQCYIDPIEGIKHEDHMEWHFKEKNDNRTK